MAEIEVIVDSLWELDEEQLEAQIGSHVQAIEDDVAGRGARGADPVVFESVEPVGGASGERVCMASMDGNVAGGEVKAVEPVDWPSGELVWMPTQMTMNVNVAAARAALDPTLLKSGKQLFDRVNPLAYDLMCKPIGDDADTQKILDETINQNYSKAAGMLAPVLVSGVGLAPAVATIVATLIIKKIANSGAKAICENWEKNLAKPAS